MAKRSICKRIFSCKQKRKLLKEKRVAKREEKEKLKLEMKKVERRKSA